MPLLPGTRLGPYDITATLGAGGMGKLYRARDTRLGREVALKLLQPQIAADPDSRARFDREARAISQLSHPHICTLHDVGVHDGHPYLVLEYLAGESLDTSAEKGWTLGRSARGISGGRASVVHSPGLRTRRTSL